MDSLGKRLDGACDGVGCIMADDAAAGTVLLVGDAHSGSGGRGENGEVCSGGNDGVVGSVEGHITYPELLSASAVLAAVAGVFANM